MLYVVCSYNRHKKRKETSVMYCTSLALVSRLFIKFQKYRLIRNLKNQLLCTRGCEAKCNDTCNDAPSILQPFWEKPTWTPYLHRLETALGF